MPKLVHQWNPADYVRHSQGQERFARELLTLLNPQPYESVLDVGCGDGRMTFEIAKLARQVVGIDRSPESVSFITCRSEPPMQPRCLSVVSLRWFIPVPCCTGFRTTNPPWQGLLVVSVAVAAACYRWVGKGTVTK